MMTTTMTTTMMVKMLTQNNHELMKIKVLSLLPENTT